MFSRLDPESTSVKMFADANYNNLPNDGSQGGHIIFLSDKTKNSCGVAWNWQRIKRVARFTLAAESLAFSEGFGMVCLISELAKEANIINVNTKISAYTNNQSLYDTVNITNLVSDRRLRGEIINEIETVWIESKKQLGDALMKNGAAPFSLMEACQQGRLAINN